MDSGNAPGADVVILTALSLESDAVVRQLAGGRDAADANGTRYVVGRIRGGSTTVAVAQLGEGNLAAAALAPAAVDRFHPRALLFTGVAGGLAPDADLGDVVVATRIHAYQPGRSESARFRPRPMGWPVPHRLEQLARQVAQSGEWRGRLTADARPRVLFKPVVSGEAVLDATDSPLAHLLTEHYSGAVAIDMESAGLAEAMHRIGYHDVLMVRGISDRAGGHKRATDASGWQQRAAGNATAFALALAERVGASAVAAQPTAPSAPVRLVAGRWPAGLAAVLIASAALLAASAAREQAPPACNLKVGFFGALTGGDAEPVTPMADGAALALLDHNREHPDCPMTLAEFDTGSESAAEAAARAVRDPSVVAMVGPVFGDDVEVAAPVFEPAGLPMITPWANRFDLGERGWSVFHRGVAHERRQITAATNYLAADLAADRVFVVDDGTEYGLQLAGQVAQLLGARLSGRGRADDESGGPVPLTAAVTRADVAALFYAGAVGEGRRLYADLRRAGWQGAFVGADLLHDPEMFAETGPQAAEGAIALCTCGPPGRAAEGFGAAYRDRFGTAPGPGSDVAYDVTRVLLDGIAAGHRTRAALSGYLDRHRGSGRASGTVFQWQDNGELTPSGAPVWAFVARAGEWVPLAELKP
ncbi:ABC transporter substrate-binding protein [Catellatospora sichuanensis]|uniref:phosphorylase family protein n=1 Tax=Catellatospora sichuanensis TaxID=1969805 RepID=UPI0016436151|nr:ABC transporter substrate-binding protein [Catellatospora sichuanensis]